MHESAVSDHLRATPSQSSRILKSISSSIVFNMAPEGAGLLSTAEEVCVSVGAITAVLTAQRALHPAAPMYLCQTASQIAAGRERLRQ